MGDILDSPPRSVMMRRMDRTLHFVALIGLGLSIGAWIWTVVMAWKTSWKWGAAVTLIPGLIVWYALAFKRQCMKPVIVWLVGLLIFGVAEGVAVK